MSAPVPDLAGNCLSPEGVYRQKASHVKSRDTRVAFKTSKMVRLCLWQQNQTVGTDHVINVETMRVVCDSSSSHCHIINTSMGIHPFLLSFVDHSPSTMFCSHCAW